MFPQFTLNKKIINFFILFLIASWIHQFISIGSFIRLDVPSFDFDVKSILSIRNFSIFLLPLNLILFFLLNKKKNFILILFFTLSLTYSIGIINYENNLFISENEKLEILKIYPTIEQFNISLIEELITPVIGMFLSILILYNLYSIEQKNIKKIILITNLIFLFLIVFIIFFQKGNLSTQPVYTLNFFGKYITLTSNGVSRTLIVLFIFFFSKLTVNQNNLNYFLILLCALCSYLIFSNEGRLNVICLVLAIVVILFVSELNSRKKIFLFLLIFITPLIVTVLVKVLEGHISQEKKEVNIEENVLIIKSSKVDILDTIINNSNIDKTSLKTITKKDGSINITFQDKKIKNKIFIEIEEIIKNIENKSHEVIIEDKDEKVTFKNKKTIKINKRITKILDPLKKNRLFKFQGEIRGRNMDSGKINYNFGSTIHDQCKKIYDTNYNEIINKINLLTTGRIKKWQCALFLNNNFLGNGPEYDRRLLTSKANPYLVQGQDVANAGIYAFLSGGLLAFICFLIIIFKYFSLCFKFFILKKKYYLKENYFFLGSLVTSGYIVGRGFFENSFASFSIDYLILISCLTFMVSEFNNLKKIH